MSWETISLGEFLTLKRGHDLPAARRQEGNVPVVSVSGITGHHNVAKVERPTILCRHLTMQRQHHDCCHFSKMRTPGM